MRYMRKRFMAFALSLSVAASVTGPTTAVMAAEDEGYLEEQEYITGELMDEVDEVSEDEGLAFSGMDETIIYEDAAEFNFEEADSAEDADTVDADVSFDDGFEGLIEDTDIDAEEDAGEEVTFYADEAADPSGMAFDYDVDEEKFIGADGKVFGMYKRAEDKTSAITLENGQVKVVHYTKNHTVFAGFYLNANIADSSTWKEENYYPADEEGKLEFTLSTDYCGKAWPVAPVKKEDITSTTSTQYYLAIPKLETLLAKKKAAEDKAAADAVSEQLTGLKEDAGLEDAVAVEAAREAYEALTEDQKKLVDAAALAKLEAAEASVTAAADKAEQEEKEKEEAEKKAQQEKEAAEKKAQQEKAAKEAADIANAKAAFKLNVASNETLPLKKKQVSTAVTATLADGDQLESAVSNKENVVKASVVGNKVKLAAANKTGTAIVTVTTVKGGEASFKVKVQKKAVVAKKAQGLKKKIGLKKGEKRTFDVVIKPITIPGKVKVTSSNKKVAVVKNGVLTAKKAGKAVITYKVGKKTFKCVVTVK